MYPIRYVTRADMAAAAAELDVSIAVIRAVTAVEARKSGFIAGSDLPVILFEGHKFHRFTDGRFDRAAPHLSHPRWEQKFYKGGRGEYDRLLEAIRLTDGDPEPALKSASWGMFQIMGFNHEPAGHDTVRDFVNDMASGEDRQLAAFVRFVRAGDGRLAESLRSRRWADFARAYNGPGYAQNSFDAKLAQEFARARAALDAPAEGPIALDRGDAAALQAALNAALGAGLTVDGWIGDNTRKAIRRFEAREGLAETGQVTRALAERLDVDMTHYFAAEA